MQPRPRTFSADQVVAEEVRIGPPDEATPAYLARPDASGPFAGIAVAHGAAGLDEPTRDFCRRLARSGYVTVCPDLWGREGPPPDPATPDRLREAVAGLPDERALGDMEASLRWLEEQREIESGHVGLAGLCMGGTLAFLLACRSWDVRACAVFYAPLRRERTPFHPSSPLDRAQALRCPLLGVFGGEDPSVPLEDIERLRDRLEWHGKEFDLATYEGAGHGFVLPGGEGRHAAAAEDAWKRLLDFLERKVRH